MANWAIMVNDGEHPLAPELLLKHADALAKDLEKNTDGVAIAILDGTGKVYMSRPACLHCDDDGYLDESTLSKPVYCTCEAGIRARRRDTP